MEHTIELLEVEIDSIENTHYENESVIEYQEEKVEDYKNSIKILKKHNNNKKFKLIPVIPTLEQSNKNKQTMDTIRALRILLNIEPNTVIDPNWWDYFMNDMTTLNALLEITKRNDYEDVLCEYEGFTVEELIENIIETNN